MAVNAYGKKSNKNRKRTLKVQFLPHGKSTSCGVLTAYFGTRAFIVKKRQIDKESHILILDVSINDSDKLINKS